MKKMEEEDRNTSDIHMYHKEEAKSRILEDSKDRTGLLKKLDTCIHPLNPSEHPGGSIVSIISGKIVSEVVNVDSAVTIGEKMLKDFEKTWPEGFYKTIPSKVKTMATTAKSIKLGNAKVYDLNAIYSRVIVLLSSDRDVHVEDVLTYELAPLPTAMFTEDGMRICKAKSALKKSLQVKISRKNAGDANITIIDGSALLWTIHWPADGTIADFIRNVKTRLTSYLSKSDVYLIFDRYYDYSTKSVIRDVRETGVSKKHHLLRSTKLPSKKVVLSSVENKKQLNRLICEELISDRLFHSQSTNIHKLVVTGEDPCPIEISMDERRIRHDLETKQEEADTIIAQQVLVCAGEAHKISVVSDDTDVFVLLLHHYQQAEPDVSLTMESPSQERAIVDIKSTLAKHPLIAKNILPAHAISGCDTVASYYGLGKSSVIKVLKAGYDLSALGSIDAPFEKVIEQATAYISACYGIWKTNDITHTRVLVWGKTNGKGNMSTPNLAALPPTNESFIENVKRAHFQAALWRNLDGHLPPEFDPVKFGWKKDTPNRSLSPTTVPEGCKPAPAYILEMIKCGCKGENPCNTKKCSCRVHGLTCTMSCHCYTRVLQIDIKE